MSLTFGKVLYECGDTFYHVCFPSDFIVSLLDRMESGASGEISMVGKEGLVGIALFIGNEGTRSRAVVQSAGTAYRLPAQRLETALPRRATAPAATLHPIAHHAIVPDRSL